MGPGPRARGWATLARVGRDLLRRLGASVGESFFMLLLEELGLEHQHFTPCFILQATIIAYLCKMFMGATLLPPAFGGEGRSPALRRRRTATCCLVRVWLSVHHTGDGRAVRGSATPTASPAPPAALGGSYKTSYAAGVAVAFLDGLVLTPVGGRG